MIAYILRRLFFAVIVVFCVFSISFLIMRVSPGSPFDQEKEIPPTVVSNQAETTGMAEPIPYFRASYEAVDTTPRWSGGDPTTTGRPRNSGRSRCSMAA